MTPSDAKRMDEYYAKSLAEYGAADARSVHWTDGLGQYERFRVLTGIIEASENDPTPTVLDVGCGTGELYKFFLTEKIPVAYSGIDIVPELAAAAKARFPEGNFECHDIFDTTAPDSKFDYVFASGSLSFKVADNQNYYEAMIRKMFEMSVKGVAFNMLNKAGHVDDDTYAAYDPRQIAEFCHKLAEPVNGQIEIFTDYLPQDFTIYLKKQ